MSRSVPEWVGKTSDERCPDRVRLRIWRRDDGTCHRTGRKIMPGDEHALDHIIAIIDGGENREPNLAFILIDPHREKTAEEVARKAKIDAVAKRHAGIKPIGPDKPILGPPMPTTARAAARAAKPSKSSLEPRSLYVEVT